MRMAARAAGAKLVVELVAWAIEATMVSRALASRALTVR